MQLMLITYRDGSLDCIVVDKATADAMHDAMDEAADFNETFRIKGSGNTFARRSVVLSVRLDQVMNVHTQDTGGRA